MSSKIAQSGLLFLVGWGYLGQMNHLAVELAEEPVKYRLFCHSNAIDALPWMDSPILYTILKTVFLLKLHFSLFSPVRFSIKCVMMDIIGMNCCQTRCENVFL